MLQAAVGPFFKTAEEAAASVLHAATSPELEAVGGVYLSECELAATSPAAADLDEAGRLWDLGAELVGLPSEVDV